MADIEIRLENDEAGVAVIDAIYTRSQRLQEALIQKVNDLSVRLQQRIQQKLLGEVLHYRSGVLFRSVRVIPAAANSYKIEGGVISSGGPAFYGRVHEFGGASVYTERPAIRDAYRSPANRAALRFIGRDGKVLYRFFVRRRPLPERSFMRSSEAEMEPGIMAEIQEVVQQALSAQPRDERGRFVAR